MFCTTIDLSKLEAASRCAAKRDVRYYLESVCVEFIRPDRCTIAGTNGHVLFAGETEISDTAGFDAPFTLLIPANDIALARKAAGKKASCVELRQVSETEWGLGAVAFSPCDAQYPNWRPIIPKSVSGEAGYLNPDYIKTIESAMKLWAGSFTYHPNGKEFAHVYTSPDACGLIMPMRDMVGQDYAPISFSPSAS